MNRFVGCISSFTKNSIYLNVPPSMCLLKYNHTFLTFQSNLFTSECGSSYLYLPIEEFSFHILRYRVVSPVSPYWYQGSRNFELKIGLDSQVTKYPPSPPLKKKQQQKNTQKNVAAKTNDIVIYASRCITKFSELSKVFFHFILKKKPK